MSDSDKSDLSEGILLDGLPQHTSPIRTAFAPWHKVRKQYIRTHQWNELARRNVKGAWKQKLIRDDENCKPKGIGGPGLSPLRCLMIPGNHLLDVRSLWRALQDSKCKISYLGFNSSQGSKDEGTEVHVAHSAIKALPGITTDSEVIKDRFESIAIQETMAWQYFRRYGPYHIVNLDFCGSLFPNNQSDTDGYYKAMHHLLEYQFRNHRDLWLLYITTLVSPKAVDLEKLQILCGATNDNRGQHNDFRDKLDELVGHGKKQQSQIPIDIQSLDSEGLVKLFGVSLDKWLTKLAHNASPQWTLGMRRSFRYTINDYEGAVMLSLAFELTPNLNPPQDHSGLSGIDFKVKDFPTEREIGIKIVESVGNINDVDNMLNNDAELHREMFAQSTELLESAGFDRDEYVEWVENGEISFEDSADESL